MATQTTTNSARAWAMDVQGFAAGDVIPEALVLMTSTVSGAVEGDEPAVRVAYVDDAAAGFVPEGVSIPEADPALSEVLVHTGKVSQLVRLSREQYNQEQTGALLSTSVSRAVMKAADRAYINQVAPVSPAVTPPAGLLHVQGITDGGVVSGNLDGLIDLVAGIEDLGGTASGFLLNPIAWASLRKLKTGTGSEQSLLGAGTADAVKTLLDLPVIVTSAVPTGTGLVFDRDAVVSAVGPVNLAMSDQAYFAADSIAVRCTFRFGANVVRPDRIAKFTVTP